MGGDLVESHDHDLVIWQGPRVLFWVLIVMECGQLLRSGVFPKTTLGRLIVLQKDFGWSLGLRTGPTVIVCGRAAGHVGGCWRGHVVGGPLLLLPANVLTFHKVDGTTTVWSMASGEAKEDTQANHTMLRPSLTQLC